MAELIKSNGEVTVVTPVNGKKFTLEELQKLVGGYVAFTFTRGGQRMAVNEDGVFMGLQLNKAAAGMHFQGVPIVGDVVVGDKKELG